MDKIKIKIIFFGSFTKKSEDKEIEAVINNDIGQVLKKIDEIIIARKGKKISYVLLLNGVNLCLKEKEIDGKIIIKNGDMFTVVPIVIGG